MPSPFESIMNLFSPAGGAKIDPPAGNMPNNPSQVANPGNPLPGTDPNNPAAPAGSGNPPQNTGNPGESVNPLDAIKDLWTLPANAPAPKTVADVFAGIDPAKMREQASKVDFRTMIPAETMAKINAGGPEAMKAMLDAMNIVAQNAYAQSAIASTKIVEQGVTRADAINRELLPGMIRNNVAGESLRSEDAAYNHPAMQPVVQALQIQLQNKNPNATAAEIKSQVVDALKAMGAALNPQKSPADAGKAKEEDWSSFF